MFTSSCQDDDFGAGRVCPSLTLKNMFTLAEDFRLQIPPELAVYPRQHVEGLNFTKRQDHMVGSPTLVDGLQSKSGIGSETKRLKK